MSSENTKLELAQLLHGPDLLVKNAFRLSQMPVDSNEKKLKKRMQVIEMAENMSMPVPDGESTVFPYLEQSTDELREALHRLQDPINRLLNEIFWFWPEGFGHSKLDAGISHLGKGDTKEAFKLWLDGEKQGQKYICTHNLAVLQQLQALEADLKVLSRKVGENSEEITQKAQALWISSLKRWRHLSQNQGFWNYLEKRIQDINDPRLTHNSLGFLRENLPRILFSINAGLIFEATKLKRIDFIERQRSILNASGYSTEVVNQILDDFTKPYRDKIKHLCQEAEDKSNRDPLRGDQFVEQLVDQVEPIIDALSHILTPENKIKNFIMDEVAETILHCQVKYGNKTENWVVSKELLLKAKKFAQGETATTRIVDNIKNVEDLNNEGNTWCVPGYFELPDLCIEALEEARDHEDGNRFEEAIKVMREILRGWRDIPYHPKLEAIASHCLAYCLKGKSIFEYNRALEEHNKNIEEAVWSSFTEDNANRALKSYRMNQTLGYGEVYCASCRLSIDGTFTIRTIQDLEVPFCNSCNDSIMRKIEETKSKMKKVTKLSLDMLVLARAIAPKYHPIIKNLKVIRDAAKEEGLSEADAEETKRKMDLQTIEEIVKELLGESEKAFKKLKNIIDRQTREFQSYTLGLIYKDLGKQPNKLSWIFKKFADDSFLTNHLVMHLRSEDSRFPQEEKYRANIYLLGQTDTNLIGQAKQLLERDMGIAFPSLLQACGSESSLQQEALTNLIKYAMESKAIDNSIDNKLLLNALFAAKSGDLSKILFTLNLKFNQKFSKLISEKDSIRALKYLESKGTKPQQKIANQMLEKERARGIFGKFNVWQWRPAKQFNLAVSGSVPWWAISKSKVAT